MRYYYISNGNGIQEGPFTLDELRTKYLTRSTLVWTEGMETWLPIVQVPSLSQLVPVSPPQQVQTQAPQPIMLPCPKTWLLEAFFTVFCCCLPFGIVAIIYALQVSSAYSSGQYSKALMYSNQARTWVVVSFICGLLLTLVVFASYSNWNKVSTDKEVPRPENKEVVLKLISEELAK